MDYSNVSFQHSFKCCGFLASKTSLGLIFEEKNPTQSSQWKKLAGGPLNPIQPLSFFWTERDPSHLKRLLLSFSTSFSSQPLIFLCLFLSLTGAPFHFFWAAASSAFSSDSLSLSLFVRGQVFFFGDNYTSSLWGLSSHHSMLFPPH